MKTRLSADRPIGPNLVLMAAELVEAAAARLDRNAVPAAVHESRVALKRARSTLRLLESAGASWARTPRLRLAEAARQLSAAREAAVALELARAMRRQAESVRREIAAELVRGVTPAAVDGVDRLTARLRAEAALLAAAPPPRLERSALLRLLRLGFGRVAYRYREARRQPTRLRLHEWRKAMIVLRDQTGFAAKVAGGRIGRAHRLLVQKAREVGRLGDLLSLETQLRRIALPRSLQGERREMAAELRTERSWQTAMTLRSWPALARELERLLTEK